MWRRSGGIFDKQMEFVLLTAKLPRVPVLFLLALCMLAFSAMQSASWAANPVLVFDVRTGKAIVARDAGKPWHPASLTKIMTAYLTLQAIDQGKLSLGTKLKVSKTSSAPPPSKIGFKPGTKVSVDFALKALLAYSANDMAALLAEGVAGSQKDFARLMNATARQLGMTGSHFVNPHGLHDREQVTTARDMAILTRALLSRYPQARSYYSAPHVKVGKKRLRNRNYLLKIWDKADGLKTGFICPSGFNLVATANVGGRQVAAVVFGTRSGKARAHKAKVVMENAAGYQGSASLVSIQNQGGKPPNLRSRVCGGKGLRMVNASQFNGWGATFGKFKSAAEAEAVVNGMGSGARRCHEGSRGRRGANSFHQGLCACVVCHVAECKPVTLPAGAGCRRCLRCGIASHLCVVRRSCGTRERQGCETCQTRQAGSHFEFFHQFHAPPVQFEPHGTRASLEPLSATADTQTG
jgi:D-alanyl-D-alanine carboxypeptidase